MKTQAQIRMTYPDMFSTAEVARMIGRTPECLVKWRKSGKLIPKKRDWINGYNVWLYNADELADAYTLARTLKSGPVPKEQRTPTKKKRGVSGNRTT